MAIKKVKSVDIISFASFSGILYAILGFIYGLLLTVFGSILFNLLRQQSDLELPEFGAAFGVAGIILFPIIFFVIGFVAGVIGSLIINLALYLIRGLKITLED